MHLCNSLKQVMGIMRILVFLALIFLAACQNNQQVITKTNHLEIKDRWYYINGEKTFISSIGYEIGARPGEHPYKDKRELQLARMRNDLKLIKEAGFNSIRTWSDLTEEEVKVVQESGLYLIFGLWIEPHGEFKDPQFVEDAKQHVKETMAYTKNYDCIITYLIMNEPMPGHIYNQGAEATVNLWLDLRDIIHSEHPDVPVTFSINSRVGEYVDQNIFDVYACNTYDHNEDHIYTQGFGPHFEYLRDLYGQEKPFLLTEFGMSVSQIGYGLYGGNTYKKQAEWLIRNYSDALDGGINGACPFYYADGWWKAGAPDTHDPYPEAWFGFWGYSDLNDTIGHPRPVWYDISEYIQAILTSPRNQQIYTNKVPVELFLTSAVSQVRVLFHDKIVFEQKDIQSKHFEATIDFGSEAIRDRELVFEFLNSEGKLIKHETIMILTSPEHVSLPVVEVELAESDMAKSDICRAKFTVKNNGVLVLDSELKYVFTKHVDWQAGENKKAIIDPLKPVNVVNASYEIPAESNILNITAGVDARFGKFVKRIHGGEIIYRGNWADAIGVK